MVAHAETQTREDDGVKQEIKLDKRVPVKLARDHTAASLKKNGANDTEKPSSVTEFSTEGCGSIRLC